ncbi:GerAB/ArcD/ProY family transporter [Paenibacillus sp. XY044]|uniref:GerAB/ArcD/ProY family transporter n=1 Tax=Paenibacillus sp. XY044 TaxID=2026089 RepID=UPI000B995820|nr:GerAB/ArcD/ProY family transporter [Paenibacillus sp. XY044]OZB95062.1 hypothetical protein CJP46_15285 [Paenibacillus sp. XY044]
MNKNQILILFFLVHLTSIFAIFPERIISSSAEGHWLPILVIFSVELIMLWFYLKALSLFPGKTVIEICTELLKKWGTGIILVPVILFLLIELVLLMYYQSVQIKAVLLQNTPKAATSALFIILCFYGAWKGITMLVRASLGLFFLCMPFVLFSMLIGIKNFRFHYIFPIKPDVSFFTHPDFYVCTVVIAGFLFLGMVPTKKRIRFGKLAAVIGIIFMFGLASVYIPLTVFGQETVVHLEYPLLLASDTIDLEWVVFDWLPSFYSVSSGALGIIKVSVLLWLTVTFLSQIYLPMVNSRWILAITCIVLYIILLNIPNVSTLNTYLYLNSYFCLYSIICFPLLVFLGAGWRRKKGST